MWIYLTYHVSCFSPQPPPFPSYCCSSIASLSFPSHPSHSPLCPPLPFATHCLLLYFLFPISFPSLHLSTDSFPGENVLLCENTLYKNSDSHHFQPLRTRSHEAHRAKRDPQNQTCTEIFVSCVLSSKLDLRFYGFVSHTDFCPEFQHCASNQSFCLDAFARWVFLYIKLWTTGWILEIQTFKTPHFKTIFQQ